jgi:hypothetical protein
MSVLKKHFTSAHGIALLALFVAMGGTGYAALSLPKNSINAKQISKNAVRSAEVKNGSLKRGDFAAGQLPAGPQGAQGAQGPQGPAGADGADGAPGADGTADAFARVQPNGTLQPNVANFPPQNKGTILVSKGEGQATTGTYCFDLPARPASAMVSIDNADLDAADRNVVASVAIDRGEDLGDCPANRNDARVRIVDGASQAVMDARFFIWFEF